jgi:predicted O-methyltransferase YrrM
MEHIYQNIDGWFDFENLYSFVVNIFNENKEGKFVEIGSWMGKSSSFMAVEIANSQKNIKFYCVDTWEGSIEHQNNDVIKNNTLFDIFLKNTELAKDYLTPIKNSSELASKQFEDESLDFIFIDAGHTYEDVKNDLKNWYPKLKQNGIIAGHDFSEAAWPGVVKAVTEWAEENNIIFSLTEQSCWITKKQTISPSVSILSCHYKEDLSWINFVKYPVSVYSKTLTNKNYIPFNKVQETPGYLKFIIDNYNNLPEYTIFVHGHLNSEHQANKNIVDIINNLSFNEDIVNLNRPDWLGSIQHGDDFWDKKYSWISENWKDMVGDYLELPLKMTFYSCCQFAVNKKCILRHPLEFWQKLFNWCENTSLDNYISSRIFEYTWYYFLSGKALYL